jgi:hypothetical protein
MITLRKVLVFLALFWVSPALAQPLAPPVLSGNESWACSLSGLQGTSGFCTSAAIKPYISTGLSTLTITGGQSNQPFILQNSNNSVAFPTPSFQPVSQNTIALDIFPKGTPSDFAGNGAAWMDICNKDIIAFGAQPFNCLHSAIFGADGHAVISTTSFNAATNTDLIFQINGVSVLKIRAADLNVQLNKTYTVATLPACAAGTANEITVVTDATAPTYNAALTGGGAVVIPVFCNGSIWTAH